MRFFRVLSLVLVLAVPVFAQTDVEPSGSLEPVATSEVNPEPTEIATTTFVETISDGDATPTVEAPNPVSTALAPVGGGANCVQGCLKMAAAGVGCKDRSV